MAKTRSRPAVPQPPKPPSSRRWPLWMMAVVLFAIIMAFLAFHWWINQPITPTPPTGTKTGTHLATQTVPLTLHATSPVSLATGSPHVSTGTGHSTHPAIGSSSRTGISVQTGTLTHTGIATGHTTHIPTGTGTSVATRTIDSTNTHTDTGASVAVETATTTGSEVASQPYVNPLPDGFESEAYRQTEKERWAFAGLPRPIASNTEYRLLRRHAYVAGYSESRRDPLWVGYRLDRMTDAEVLKRPAAFRTDKQTSSQVQTKEYVNSGYDRGHMAPNSAIARCYGAEAQKDTFLMSNVIPQAPELNQGIWEKLERKEEKYANSFGHIYVFTGPIFDSRKEYLQNLKTEEQQTVEIPDAVFKILVKEDGRDIKILAFRFPNALGEVPRHEKNLAKYLTSVEEIEKETGLDFFSAITDTLEESLEHSRASIPWEIPEDSQKRSSD